MFGFDPNLGPSQWEYPLRLVSRGCDIEGPASWIEFLLEILTRLDIIYWRVTYFVFSPFCFFLIPGSLLCFAPLLLFFSAFCFSVFLLLCFFASLLFWFCAFLFFCFSAFLLLCFSASLLFRFLFLCFCFSAFCFFAFLFLCFCFFCFSAFLLFPASLLVCFSVSTSMSTSISTSISISIPMPIPIPIAYIYLSKRFALSSRWYSNPKPPLNQARIYSTPEILNQHDDNIQWNYCALLCLNLPSTCFQGVCRA